MIAVITGFEIGKTEITNYIKQLCTGVTTGLTGLPYSKLGKPVPREFSRIPSSTDSRPGLMQHHGQLRGSLNTVKI